MIVWDKFKGEFKTFKTEDEYYCFWKKNKRDFAIGRFIVLADYR